jgi:RNA polymerase sigma factor (sigma-70 family)
LGKIVFKVASIYARGAENRNDLAQEIRVQLWRSFSSYDARAKFSTWMYRVALNVAISQVRRRRIVPTDRIDSLNEGHIETIANDEEPSVEDNEHLSE